MKVSDLVFIGIKGSVIALNRATGEQLWVTQIKGRDFVNVVVQNGAVLAACDGEIFCLDPFTGHQRWHNPLKGFGMGLATIASENLGSSDAAVMAEQRRCDEAASAAASSATP